MFVQCNFLFNKGITKKKYKNTCRNKKDFQGTKLHLITNAAVIVALSLLQSHKTLDIDVYWFVHIIT